MNKLRRALYERYKPNYDGLTEKEIRRIKYLGTCMAREIIGPNPKIDEEVKNTLLDCFCGEIRNKEEEKK